ncbi:hypothetical protein D3C76_1750250 [compost metagenome]
MLTTPPEVFGDTMNAVKEIMDLGVLEIPFSSILPLFSPDFTIVALVTLEALILILATFSLETRSSTLSCAPLAS